MLSIFAYGGHFGRPLIRSFCQQLKESEERQRRENLTRLITASCGFPKKSSLPGLSSATGRVSPKLGTSGSAAGSPSTGFILHHTQDGIFGDDAWFVADYDTTQVIGVADGVGGWRDYGVDASVFPRHLMKQCERIVKEGRFQVQRPTSILSGGYDAMYDLKQPIVGSSTVCIVVLERLANTLYSANLGDSGCLVVRSGSIVHRTAMQQHFFNTPFQLAMLPPPVPGEAEGGILSDRVVDCSEERFQLQVGDIVMVATDGLFDNLADSHILKELNYLDKKSPDEDLLRDTVERLATKARQMSHDPHYSSPFSKLARLEAGLNITGGKPDDITVLLSWVAPPGESARTVKSSPSERHTNKPTTHAGYQHHAASALQMNHSTSATRNSTVVSYNAPTTSNDTCSSSSIRGEFTPPSRRAGHPTVQIPSTTSSTSSATNAILGVSPRTSQSDHSLASSFGHHLDMNTNLDLMSTHSDNFDNSNSYTNSNSNSTAMQRRSNRINSSSSSRTRNQNNFFHAMDFATI
ncbi:uncharacterized protein LOC142341525 [Convolutriloba macropyga]|uniref:uncharacterized protein LOC142341525 n=1 Tax=Convolutriloba macropyga TaxID=536237 RepID=UPI003F51E28C